MINQSEMYRISGGCVLDKKCKDCENFVDGKKGRCLIYPREFYGNWKGERMACKFFYKNDNEKQFTIMDYLKGSEDDGEKIH